MPLSPYALATVAGFRDFTSLAIADVSDAVVESLLNAVTAGIENWCRRHLAVRDYDEEYYAYAPVASVATAMTFSTALPGEPTKYAPFGRFVLLRERPVISVTLVEADDDTVDVDDYEIQAERGILESDQFMGTQKIHVEYRAGLLPIPDDLAQCCIELAYTLWDQRNRGRLRSETLGPYSWTAADDKRLIDDAMASRLRYYKESMV